MKNYTIAVGRTQITSNAYNVRCSEDEIVKVAMAHYNYHKEQRTFGDLPIMCAYCEGDSFNFHGKDNVVLIDCM